MLHDPAPPHLDRLHDPATPIRLETEGVFSPVPGVMKHPTPVAHELSHVLERCHRGAKAKLSTGAVQMTLDNLELLRAEPIHNRKWVFR